MYNLHALGWRNFQQLCLTITREILGQTVESYLDTHDAGQDGAFAGTWKTESQEDLTGAFVIQCKFTSRSDHVIRASALVEEAEKAGRLVERGICESYILMTNAGLTGTGRTEIVNLFKSAGVKYVRILGSNWINSQIQERKELRRLVPRLYGLGDLSQILDERAYKQAQAILESMGEDLSKVIVTDAYRKAVEAIDEYGFVLLVGEPAVGKTTIASLLAMAALDEWGSSTLKVDDPSKLMEHWNPDEPSQFFWVDDAFGVTQYDFSLAYQWNRTLPNMRALINGGARVVLTSRDYIYSRARADLKENAFPMLKESQVVIDVKDLTLEEKEQILYNHLKLGNQPNSFRTEIKPYLDEIASRPRFIPETARRLGDPLFTRDLVIDAYHLNEFVDKREQILLDILQNLDADSRAALALIYMRGDHLESPIVLRPSEKLALERLGSTLGKSISALEALADSFVTQSYINGEYIWKFKHPTIGDAVGHILSRNSEYLDIYVNGTAPERLIEQVTCGDVNFENAVVIPKSLFPQVIAKVLTLESNKDYRFGVGSWLSGIQGFLMFRCSKEFLSLYLQQDPGLLDKISSPGLFLEGAPEVRLAKRLQDLGILPERVRKKFVESVSDYAVEGMDGSAFGDEDIRSFFTKDELDNLTRRVKVELLPCLRNIQWEWESNLPDDILPEDYMQPLVELLESAGAQFAGDEDVVKRLGYAKSDVYQWIDENTPEEPTSDNQRLGRPDEPDGFRIPESQRSTFDDIDADENAINDR